MNAVCRKLALTVCLMVGLVTSSFAEEYDPNIQARDSLRLTLERHIFLPRGKPSFDGVKEHAAFLMLIKNSLSLYRDGYLTQQDGETMVKFIKAHLDYTDTVLASSSTWPQQRRTFLRVMQYHALAANQLITMQSNDPNFKGLMEAYHAGIGYDAYRKAQDLGVEQYWEQAL
ncbi:hypothetical protein D9M70_577270 [compost metagenome]